MQPPRPTLLTKCILFDQPPRMWAWVRIPLLTPMWKDARHVWITACMCLLHPTLASFSTWPRIIGVAAPYHRVGQYATFKFQYTQLIYGYNCVLIHGLHCGLKDQLTPCDNIYICAYCHNKLSPCCSAWGQFHGASV